MPVNLNEFTAEVGEWQNAMWPDDINAGSRVIKAMEELGELAEAVLKGFPISDIQDEAADVIICIVGLCAVLNIDLEDALASKWDRSKKKPGGWTKYEQELQKGNFN